MNDATGKERNARHLWLKDNMKRHFGPRANVTFLKLIARALGGTRSYIWLLGHCLAVHVLLSGSVPSP
jgi:hypothetical protein